MKKFFWLMIFVVTMGLILSYIGYSNWPISKTLPIEGKVIDEVTGEPIENALVSFFWWKDYFIGGPGGPGRNVIASKYVLTDKEGRYKISGRRSLHILSRQGSLDMYVSHPLHERKTNHGFYIKPHGTKEWIYRDEHNKKLDLKPQNGIIHYDIKLMSLEEKYVKGIEEIKEKVKKGEMSGKEKKGEIAKIAGNLIGYFSSYENGRYWLILQDKNISYNIDFIFKRWDEIAKKVFYDENVKYFLTNYFPRYKKNIIKKLNTR